MKSLIFLFLLWSGNTWAMRPCESWLEGFEQGLYPTKLETENLTLRRVKPTRKDLKQIKAVFQSPDMKKELILAGIWDGVSRKQLNSLAHLTTIGTQQTSHPGYETRELHLAIALKENPELIVGQLVIYRYDVQESGGEKYSREPSVSMGYTILPEYRGRGFATEVVRAVALDLRRQNPERQPFVSILIENEASVRVAEKAGYELTSIQEVPSADGKGNTFAYYYFRD